MANSTAVAEDLIVVVHGISSHRLVMLPLCARLRARNFRVLNWGYFSVAGSVERHGQRLRNYLTGELAHERRIHFVAHSMGSIVVRSAFAGGTISNLGRAVFLAPPNIGSPVSRCLAYLCGGLCRPLTDLSDLSESYVNSLPALAEIEIGVLAGRYDLLVPVANTHLAGQRDHIVLSATHNSLLISRAAADYAVRFLQSGSFAEVKAPAECRMTE